MAGLPLGSFGSGGRACHFILLRIRSKYLTFVFMKSFPLSFFSFSFFNDRVWMLEALGGPLCRDLRIAWPYLENRGIHLQFVEHLNRQFEEVYSVDNYQAYEAPIDSPYVEVVGSFDGKPEK